MATSCIVEREVESKDMDLEFEERENVKARATARKGLKGGKVDESSSFTLFNLSFASLLLFYLPNVGLSLSSYCELLQQLTWAQTKQFQLLTASCQFQTLSFGGRAHQVRCWSGVSGFPESSSFVANHSEI